MSEAWPQHIHPPSAPPQEIEPPRPPTTAEVRSMHGEPVLVMPAATEDKPAVGMRGSLRVSPQGHVDIDLQFADMYDRPAAMQRVRLSAQQVSRLWASKVTYGAYAVRLDGPLTPPGTGERIVGTFGRSRAQAAVTHNAAPRAPRRH